LLPWPVTLANKSKAGKTHDEKIVGIEASPEQELKEIANNRESFKNISGKNPLEQYWDFKPETFSASREFMKI